LLAGTGNRQLWQLLEYCQVLQTNNRDETTQDILVELNRTEAPQGEYPQSTAFLHFLYQLLRSTLGGSNNDVVRRLGQDRRSGGFLPYLEFVKEVFLKYDVRTYKAPNDKWEVAVSTLRIVHLLLSEDDQQEFGELDRLAGGRTLDEDGMETEAERVRSCRAELIGWFLANRSQLLYLVLSIIRELARVVIEEDEDELSLVVRSREREEAALLALRILKHLLTFEMESDQKARPPTRTYVSTPARLVCLSDLTVSDLPQTLDIYLAPKWRIDHKCRFAHLLPPQP